MSGESSVPIELSHRHAGASEGSGEADDWGWLRMIERDADAGGAPKGERERLYVCSACGDEVVVELHQALSLADEP